MQIQNSIQQIYAQQQNKINQKNAATNLQNESSKIAETKNINSSESLPKPADLTHMTPMEMREWLNEQIRTGKMTLDESTPFVGMTIGAETNNAPVNYLEKIQVGIDAAIWRGDHKGKVMWEMALDIAQNYQSNHFGIRTYA